MANELVIRGGIKIDATLGSGTGDPLLARDATSGLVGLESSALTTSLADGRILIGSALGVATAIVPTGDVTITNAGVTAIGSGVIVNADVNASAAIAVSKLAAVTASRAIVSDGSGFISAATTTATEIGYVNGVTSAIQTQLNAKQATITGGATTITSVDLTANRLLISSGTGKVAVSTVTNTEAGYLSGVTSAIQTQLGTKLSVTLASEANGDILRRSGGVWANYAIGTNGQVLTVVAGAPAWAAASAAGGLPIGGTANQYLKKVDGTDYNTTWDTLTTSDITDITATAAEINILSGVSGVNAAEISTLANVTSDIQTQLNNKLGTALTTDNLFKGVGGVATATTDLPTGITIGSSYIYRNGGTDVTLADGGTGASLADPNADRIMFWDDSAGQVTWLTPGTNLTITGTTLDATGGGTIGGSTGSTDNILLRSDGTGGSTLQASSIVISDTADVTLGVAATGATGRTIAVAGSGSNISLFLNSKGSGGVVLEDNSSNVFLTAAINGTTISGTTGNEIRLSSALTNTVGNGLKISHTTSGTPATGIGTGLQFETTTSASNNEIGATIEAVTTDATAASEDFDLVFKTMAAGTAAKEGARLTSVGQLKVTTESTISGAVIGLVLTGRTSASPAVGMGNAIAFKAENSSNNDVDSADIRVISTNITAGTEAFDMTFNLVSGGGTVNERMRLKDNGSLGLFGATTFDTGVGVLSMKNATTAPAAGDLDTTIVYSTDISAGRASLHINNENGEIIKLYTTNSGSAYSITNGTTDRTYDANATTVDELADILYTLIQDLKNTGLIA